MTKSLPPNLYISPKLLLGLFWCWLFLRNAVMFVDRDTFWVASYTSKIAFIVSPLLLLLMLFVCIFEAHRYILRKYLGLIIIFSCLFISFVISLTANQPPLANVIQFYLGYFQFFVIVPFVIICFDKSKVNVETLKKYLMIPLMIEFIINITWLLGISPLPNIRLGGPDWAYGTMSAPQELAGISSLLIFISIYWLIFKKEQSKKVKWTTALAVLFIGFMQLIFADSKLTFMTVCMGLATGCLIISKQNIIKKFIISIVSVLMICGIFMLNMVYQYHTRMKAIYQGQSNPGAMFLRDFRTLGKAVSFNPKIKVYSIVSNKLLNEVDFPFWGAGPGNATSRFGIKSERPLAVKYIIPQVNFVFENKNNSYLYKPDTGFISVWGELGIIGAIFYYLAYMFLIFKVVFGLKNGKFDSNTNESTIAFAFVCFGFYFLFHSFIKDKFYIGSEVAFFWISGTILYIILKNKESEANSFRNIQ